ncbi:MAG: response regulator [Deltaproteobacteria bacterium]|nr:response regulator [Deltaproteobacteria bacterium]MBW2137308.1 response regulator [Deltaproteobacteria bacterium]
MERKVLIVDDDTDTLQMIKKGLEKFHADLSAITAPDGLAALDILKKHTISLVLTDLKMPKMDGFGLMAAIMEHYPEIPVIVMTGYTNPELERITKEEGAAGYIAKPFHMEELIKKIVRSLGRETEGGTLHGISSGMFLQLIEMEQKTCTIRVFDKSSGKLGLIFFLYGELIDARADNLLGEEAALKIFSWDKVSISIENSCPRRKKRINRDLQAVLMDAMRLKDEEGYSDGSIGTEAEDDEEDSEGVDQGLTREADITKHVRASIEKGLGDLSDVEDIYQDNSWDKTMTQFRLMGRVFGAGDLGLAYVHGRDNNHFILLPGTVTTMVFLTPSFRRDRLIDALMDW